jgi:hypothetical protein
LREPSATERQEARSDDNEYRVKLERVKRGEHAVPLGYPDNLVLRTKLAGKPDWIQCDETPECEECGEPMDFVAKLDSLEATIRRNNTPESLRAATGVGFPFRDRLR